MTVRGGEGRFWWPAVGAVALALAVPFFLVEVPPVQDYPNHLARLAVLAFGASDPVVAAMYAPHWAVLPNLAVDLIGPPLLHLLPVHVAGRLVLAGALFLPLIGMVAYARAAFGSWSWWSLAGAGLIAYNAIFILGFMNFLYGLGLALLGAALWLAERERRPAAAVAGTAVAAAAVFFCHILAVAYLALLIGADELHRLWRRWRGGTLSGRSVVGSVVMVGIALAPAIVLYVLSPFAEATGLTLWDPPLRKIFELFVPFLAYDGTLAMLTGVAVIAAIVLLRHRFSVHSGAAIALAVLAVAYVFAPGTLKGGSFVDTRLPLMMGLLLFAGLRPQFTRGEGRLVGVAAVILIALRVGSVGLAWDGHRDDLAQFRQAAALVPPGVRVLVAAAGLEADPARVAEPASRIIPNLSRTDRHIAALLLIERRAFWPLLFADPRQQPLMVRPPYDRITFPLGEPPDYHHLAPEQPTAEELLGAPYLAGWRAAFDFVLIVNAGAAPDLEGFLPGTLQLLHRSDFAALFAVRR